jgi:hypothetical protein
MWRRQTRAIPEGKKPTMEKLTAKDSRTWKGTTEMILALHELGRAENAIDAKKKITEAVKMTSQKLRTSRVLYPSGRSRGVL